MVKRQSIKAFVKRVAACFFGQPCVEKYVKARLVEADTVFPKTHDLEALLEPGLPFEPLWEVFRPHWEN